MSCRREVPGSDLLKKGGGNGTPNGPRVDPIGKRALSRRRFGAGSTLLRSIWPGFYTAGQGGMRRMSQPLDPLMARGEAVGG